MDTHLLISRGMDGPITMADVIYAKHRDLCDINGDLTKMLCTAINTITPDEAISAQLIRGIWFLYVKSDLARCNLLRHGKIHLGHRVLYLYDANPYTTRPRVPNERIVIKDLPLYEPHELIYNFLSDHSQIQPVGEIKFSKSRTSDFFTGDRYIFVQGEFTPPLPKSIQLGDYQCRVWHASQNSKCLRCRMESHSTTQVEMCPAYASSQSDVIPFKNPKNVLTNFFSSPMTFADQAFNNAEQAYLWTKCTDLCEPELAERVYRANSAAEAKRISGEIPAEKDFSEWNKKKYSIMKDVLLAKAKYCPLYCDVLLQSESKLLVESTKDDYWGANLSPDLVKTTIPAYYPGKNNLGKIHMEIRDILVTENQQNPPSAPIQSSTSSAASVTPVVSTSSAVSTALTAFTFSAASTSSTTFKCSAPSMGSVASPAITAPVVSSDAVPNTGSTAFKFSATSMAPVPPTVSVASSASTGYAISAVQPASVAPPASAGPPASAAPPACAPSLASAPSPASVVPSASAAQPASTTSDAVTSSKISSTTQPSMLLKDTITVSSRPIPIQLRDHVNKLEGTDSFKPRVPKVQRIRRRDLKKISTGSHSPVRSIIGFMLKPRGATDMEVDTPEDDVSSTSPLDTNHHHP